MRKIAASVLSKLFTIGNENCHTTDAPYRVSGTLYSDAKKHTIEYPRGPENFNYTMNTHPVIFGGQGKCAPVPPQMSHV